MRKPIRPLKTVIKTKRLRPLRKRRINKQVPKKIKSYVNRVLARNVENKLAQPYVFNNTPILPYGVASPTASTIIAVTSTMLNNITQGTGQGNRIGNEITVKSAHFKGFVNKLFGSGEGNTQANNACYLKMVLLRYKNSLDSPTILSGLMQNGSSSAPPNNLPSDMYRYFNKDAFIIFTTRMFKLGSTQTDTSSGQQNNDFSVSKYFKINLTKHLPKKIKYTDGFPDPTNTQIYAVFLLCNYNGDAIVTGTPPAYPAVEIHGDVSLVYEDA